MSYDPCGAGLFPDSYIEEPTRPCDSGWEPVETFWSRGHHPVRSPEEEADAKALALEVGRLYMLRELKSVPEVR